MRKLATALRWLAAQLDAVADPRNPAEIRAELCRIKSRIDFALARFDRAEGRP